MQRFANLNISTKLSALVGVFVVGFLTFALISWGTLNRVKIHGKLYHDIVQGKDLIADILPPPAYIIESYLVALQLAGEQDKTAAAELVRTGQALTREYETRRS